MQACGRLVEHINHPEQIGADLRRQTQALQFARRQGRRAPIQRQITQSQLLQGRDPRHQVMRDALRGDAFFFRQIGRAPHVRRPFMCRAACCDASCGVLACGAATQRRMVAIIVCVEVPFGGRPQTFGHPIQRHLRKRADIDASKGDCQGFGLEPLALADRTHRADHEARDALLHLVALRIGEGVQHVFARPHERALIAGLQLAPQCRTRLRSSEAGVDRYRWLLLGKQNPVARFLWQLAPGLVDFVAQGDQNVAQVLSVPSRWPSRDCAFADRQRIVGHHRLRGHCVNTSKAMAIRARTLRCVRREVFGVQHRLPRGIAPGARIQHPQQTRQCGDAADRGPRTSGAALLLQGDGWRQAVDRVDVRDAHLVDQPARVRRYRFKVAALCFGVQRTEGER